MRHVQHGHALITAIRQGDFDRVCSLLDDGFSPDTWDANNIPGLVIAAEAGHIEILEILLAAGAHCLGLLIEKPQNSDHKWLGFVEPGPMSLWAAAKAGHVKAFTMLLSF